MFMNEQTQQLDSGQSRSADDGVKISLLPVKVVDGVRLDLQIQNAPADFFGLAFHLKISGAPWDLQKYQLGEVFRGIPQPFVLVNMKNGLVGASNDSSLPVASQQVSSLSTPPQNAEIVFGLSLQRGQNLSVQEGNVVSFYLKTAALPTDLKFQFTDQVLSLLQEQRKDFNRVSWQVENLVNSANPVNLAGSAADLQNGTPNLQNSGSLIPGTKADLLNLPNEQLVQVYTVLLIAFVVFLAFLVGVYIYSRKK